MSTTKTQVNKINTVVVPVSDQDRVVAFYVEKLGLEKRTDIEFGNGYRWIEVAPRGGETTIALAPGCQKPAPTLNIRAPWLKVHSCSSCARSAAGMPSARMAAQCW